MSETAAALAPAALREILVTDVGIDAEELDNLPETALVELGLDSMAQVELGVVLRTRHGIPDLPDDANEMSFTEMAAHLCRAES